MYKKNLDIILLLLFDLRFNYEIVYLSCNN